MRRGLSVVAMGLLLGAAAAPAVQRTNPFNEQLRALDPLNKVAALRRSVLTSGNYCDRVTLWHDDGPYKNLGKWSVRCKVGGDYAVFLGPDGSIQTRECDTLPGLKLPACTLPGAAPAPSVRAPRRR